MATLLLSSSCTNKTISVEDTFTKYLRQVLIILLFIQLNAMSHSWRIEKGLARARWAIKEAARSRSNRSYIEEEFVPRGSIYINPYAFHQLRFYSSLIYLINLYFIQFGN